MFHVLLLEILTKILIGQKLYIYIHLYKYNVDKIILLYAQYICRMFALLNHVIPTINICASFSLFNLSGSERYMTKYQIRIADLSISSIILSDFLFMILNYFVRYLHFHDDYIFLIIFLIVLVHNILSC